MIHRGIDTAIKNHTNFGLMPHAEEALEGEAEWLIQNKVVVPYHVPEDVFKYKNAWFEHSNKDERLMTVCPNLSNPYYYSHYEFINDNFKMPFIKIYGVQPQSYADKRIVGTISREELLGEIISSKGFLYTYKEPNVCFLPPIEMMICGGPVLFPAGCLLDKMTGGRAPGQYKSISEANKKIDLLMKSDRFYTRDIIAAQSDIIRRYSMDYVNAIFDKEFKRVIFSDIFNKQKIKDNKSKTLFPLKKWITQKLTDFNFK